MTLKLLKYTYVIIMKLKLYISSNLQSSLNTVQHVPKVPQLEDYVLSILLVWLGNKKYRAVFNSSARSRIWGSHGGEYEGGCLLGCSAV
jgi:hypothetical protein